MERRGDQLSLRELLWPSDAMAVGRISRVAQGLLGISALVVSVISVIGWWDLPADFFSELILAAAGIVLLTLFADSIDRNLARREQQALVHAARAATGQLGVRQIGAHEIGDGIRRLLEESSEWTFRGGSGRYLRNATLPRLAQIRERDVDIEIQILDPRDESLCREYAAYRSRYRADSVRRPDEGKVETIVGDLLAVIAAAVWYNMNSRIRPHVVLLRSFSPLRYDIGSTGLFVTLPDPVEPALYATRDSWYYASVLDEMRQSAHGHPSLRLPSNGVVSGTSIDHLDAAGVLESLRQTLVVDPLLGETPLLNDEQLTSRLDFKSVAKKVFLHESPY